MTPKKDSLRELLSKSRPGNYVMSEVSVPLKISEGTMRCINRIVLDKMETLERSAAFARNHPTLYKTPKP
jgi:hypothetical protein